MRKHRLFLFSGVHPYVLSLLQESRGVGLGSVRGTKRKRGEGVWELRVYVGRDPVTGNPKQVSKTFHGSAREADEALRDLIEQAGSRALRWGTGPRSASSSTPGCRSASAWTCRRRPCASTGHRSSRRSGRPWARSRSQRLGAKDLDDLYRAMKEKGSSPKTVRNHHAILAAALHQAVRWGWVRRNVAEMAKPPRVTQRVVRPPSVDAVRQLVVAAEERDPRLAPLVMMAALTGMRRGELCALRWSDLDLDEGQIEVARSVVLVPGDSERRRRRPTERGVWRSTMSVSACSGLIGPESKSGHVWPTRNWARCLHLLPVRRRLTAVPAGQRDQLLHQSQRRAQAPGRTVT